MSVALSYTNVSEVEYFAMCEDNDVRLELVDGQIYAMTGGTRQHNTVTGNVYSLLWQFLKGKSCRPFMENVRVKIEDSYVYPDVVVDCGDDDDDEDLYASRPTVIVEVLSDSTRRYDLNKKFAMYKTIASLQEYVVIEQGIMRVDIYRKDDDWNAIRYEKGDDVDFHSIGLSVPIAEIYDRILFAEDITAKTIRLARDIKKG